MWKEGVRIYDTPGITNNFALFLDRFSNRHESGSFMTANKVVKLKYPSLSTSL